MLYIHNIYIFYRSKRDMRTHRFTHIIGTYRLKKKFLPKAIETKQIVLPSNPQNHKNRKSRNFFFSQNRLESKNKQRENILLKQIRIHLPLFEQDEMIFTLRVLFLQTIHRISV